MKEFRNRFNNINPRHAKLEEDPGKDNECVQAKQAYLSLSAHSTYTTNSECLFVIHFHTVPTTFTKFCMIAEDLYEEVLIV
jgi:hypothetical protein